MTWAADQVFGAYHRPELVEVSSRANVWQDIVTMPAADVRVGHDYAFILTGILGAFAPLPFGNAVCDVTLLQGTSPYTSAMHRQDMSLTPYQAASGGWGQPFQTIVIVPSAVVTDYKMSYRADGGSAKIDAPAMQVWDLTELGANAYTASNTTPLQTLAGTAQRALLGPLLGANKKWLVYFSAEIDQRAWYEANGDVPPVGGIWLTPFSTDNFDVKHRRTYYNANGPQSSHIGCGPRASSKARLDRKYTRIRLGDWGIVEDVAQPRPSVWCESLLGIGSSFSHDVVHRVEMVCINIDDATKEVDHQRVESSARLFPGLNDDLIGSRDLPRSVVKPFSPSYSLPKALTLTSVRAGSYSREVQRNTGTTANFLFDIDASKVNPRGWTASKGDKGLANTLYVLLRDSAECLPVVRLLNPVLDQGTHCFRLYGRHDRQSDQTAPAFWPSFYDAEFAMLLPRASFVAPQPILETAGPEVVVKIRRETLADVSSLPVLPDGYSNRIQFEGVDTIEDFRSEIGYLHRLPRFAKLRRIVSLRYHTLTALEADAVTYWLRNLEATHGCFRWAPPDLVGEYAYALEVESGWQTTQLSKGLGYDVTFRAIELLYSVDP